MRAPTVSQRIIQVLDMTDHQKFLLRVVYSWHQDQYPAHMGKSNDIKDSLKSLQNLGYITVDDNALRHDFVVRLTKSGLARAILEFI